MHRNDLESFNIHNIDLHYHAGQERQQGTTLEGYLDHAALTGRIILGITDHLEKYIGNPLSPGCVNERESPYLSATPSVPLWTIGWLNNLFLRGSPP